MYYVELINGSEVTTIQDIKSSNLRLLTGSIAKSINTADAFTFSVLPNNPAYGKIKPLLTRIIVKGNRQDTLFSGRVLKPTDTMTTTGDLSRSYVCEGPLAYFHDVIPGYETVTGTWAAVIRRVLDIYNSQTEAWKHISAGSIPETGNLVLELTPETDIYDTLNKLIVTDNSYDWRVNIDRPSFTLDVATEIGTTMPEPKIELSRNLESMTLERDPSSIVSRIIPLGKTKDGQPAEGKTMPRVTLTDGGYSYYIDSPDLIAAYGVQAKSIIYDTVTDPNDLLNKGKSYLSGETSVTTKYTITALDLSSIGLDISSFSPYNRYHLTNPLMGVDDDLRVNGITIDLFKPQDAQLTIGDKMRRSIDFTIEALKSTNGALGNVKSIKEDVRSIKESQSTQYELIKKLQEEIKNLQVPQPPIGGDQYYEGSIIDVSEFQGSINWPQVVSSGLALSIIRVQSGSSHIDKTYTANIPNAISAGANYAVYAYFSALNAADAEVEARDFYNRATSAIGSRKQPRFWMIDVEENSVTSGTLSAAVKAYMNKLNSLGIPDSKIVIYVSNTLYPSIDTSRTQIWIPSYGINDGTVANSRKPLYPYDLWQYTSVGRVSGISGNVDMSTEPSTRFKDGYLKR